MHAEAVARGDKFYTDPTNGLMVMTELVHKCAVANTLKCCSSVLKPQLALW